MGPGLVFASFDGHLHGHALASASGIGDGMDRLSYLAAWLVNIVILIPHFCLALIPCFENGTDGGTPINGQWIPAPHLLSGDPSRAAQLVQCRVQGGGHRTCVDFTKPHKLGEIPTPTSGGEPQTFQPSTCALSVPDSAGLVDAVGPTRNIYFFGDSILMQHRSVLRCYLNDFLNETNPGRTLRLSNGGRLTFYRVSTLKHLEKQLEGLAKSRHSPTQMMFDHDVCIFNVGVHYNSKEDFQNEFLNYFERQCLKASCLPCKIVWRESAHQHFPGPKGGLFIKPDPKCKGCVSVPEAEMAANNWRNDMANALMGKYNIPILRVWKMTALAHQMHPTLGGYSHSSCDCTHFCTFMGGVFDAWSLVLQSFLESLPSV